MIQTANHNSQDHNIPLTKISGKINGNIELELNLKKDNREKSSAGKDGGCYKVAGDWAISKA
ncbi:MAG: hypothetical protein ACM3X9_05920 [Bacillota bacterium]